jgi:hypothetical protein
MVLEMDVLQQTQALDAFLAEAFPPLYFMERSDRTFVVLLTRLQRKPQHMPAVFQTKQEAESWGLVELWEASAAGNGEDGGRFVWEHNGNENRKFKRTLMMCEMTLISGGTLVRQVESGEILLGQDFAAASGPRAQNEDGGAGYVQEGVEASWESDLGLSWDELQGDIYFDPSFLGVDMGGNLQGSGDAEEERMMNERALQAFMEVEIQEGSNEGIWGVLGVDEER